MDQAKKKSLIKSFFRGLPTTDESIEEDYIDWFFLSNFGKGQGYWKSLPTDKLQSIMAFQNLKEEETWKTWIEIYKKMR